jgi:OPA family glycerol-3-phosphate transporter-like MFS transporter
MVIFMESDSLRFKAETTGVLLRLNYVLGRALRRIPGSSGGRVNGKLGGARNMFMPDFAKRRTLEEYPLGAYRWSLVLLTVLAALLAGYENQLAPILPLLLPYLHLEHIQYGYFITFTLLVSGISAFFGGPLADRYGRVVMLNTCLALITILVFANLLIVGIKSFVVIRTAMSLVAGLMTGSAAALVRDMSPRLTRALAFGLLTIGPIGSNYLADFIAGWTLPVYHTWQSQMWIMGFVATGMYIPICLWLKDLSPELRLKIFQSEVAALEVAGERRPTAAELPSSTRHAFAMLLGHFEPWLMVMPFTISLSLYVAIQVFGPLMFTESFHYTPAEAARMNSYFWLGNMGALIVIGIVSDRLQSRRPISIIGATLLSLLLAWWIPTFGVALPHQVMIVVATLLGCLFAMVVVPWAALYSETLEDVSPTLQATGWAFYGFVVRAWVAVSAPLMLAIAARYGWAAWMQVSLGGMVLYALAMIFAGRLSVATPSRPSLPIRAAGAQSEQEPS